MRTLVASREIMLSRKLAGRGIGYPKVLAVMRGKLCCICPVEMV